jgi:hypothetical protein
VNESVPVLDDAVPFRDDLVVDLNDAIKKRRPELNDIAAARLKVYVCCGRRFGRSRPWPESIRLPIN